MTQKDRQLLLKDLCARLPYEMKVVYLATTYTVQYIDIKLEEVKLNSLNHTLDIGYIKPYLRPLSSMTEEEKEEASEAIEIELKALQGPGGFTVENAASYAFEIDFYNKHHLDYRGLIPMGIALEAPEGMYE